MADRKRGVIRIVHHARRYCIVETVAAHGGAYLSFDSVPEPQRQAIARGRLVEFRLGYSDRGEHMALDAKLLA